MIFDMDGTLWNATDTIMKAYAQYLETTRGWKDYISQELMDSVQGLTIEEIGDVFFPQLPKAERLELIEACMDNELVYLGKHGGKLYPKVDETLKALSKNYQLMIVTNAQDGYVEAMFQYHGLKEYFKDWETHGRTRLEKGDNIKLIMERNGLSANECVYVGDTKKDQEACKAANVDFIYCTYGFGEVDTYDAKIHAFEELVDTIASM